MLDNEPIACEIEQQYAAELGSPYLIAGQPCGPRDTKACVEATMQDLGESNVPN